MRLHADWAVTMGCDHACPYVPRTVQAWSVPDPAGRPLEEIRACADAFLARYDDAPVRGFRQTIVTRQARECLRQDTCEALAVSACSA
jgi:hypothetical protein